MIIFLDLPHIEVEGVEVAEEITLTLCTISPTAACPSCGTLSSRIQSRYTRKLRDIPSVGRPILLTVNLLDFTYFGKMGAAQQNLGVCFHARNLP